MDETKIQKEMERLKDELTETIANVMAGKKNAGKFFSCVDFVDADGNAQSWKIEPIEMNIDKYIEAQAKISRIADSSTTSGFGLSPALANIIIDGKSDSGSQMLYALKIFYGADTQIPEDIVLEQSMMPSVLISRIRRGFSSVFTGRLSTRKRMYRRRTERQNKYRHETEGY